MFLTITIDTSQKNKTVKFAKSKLQAERGWKKEKNGKKAGFLRRIRYFFRSFKVKQYRLGKQVIGF
jgi:hypothetical protein